MTREPRQTLGSLRRAARLAAVQALYQMELSGGSAEDIIAEFAAYRVGRSEPSVVPDVVDDALFGDLVRGASATKDTADRLIGEALDKERSVQRLEVLMRAILRAGVYELVARTDIDSALTIGEYVAVADAFFHEREPALVNAVLDRIARRLSEERIAAEATHDAAQDR